MNKYTEYTDALRNRLQKLIDTKNVSLYRVEMQTGVHRQIIKSFLNGKGIIYENGMALKTFVKNNMTK